MTRRIDGPQLGEEVFGSISPLKRGFVPQLIDLKDVSKTRALPLADKK